MQLVVFSLFYSLRCSVLTVCLCRRISLLRKETTSARVHRTSDGRPPLQRSGSLEEPCLPSVDQSIANCLLPDERTRHNSLTPPPDETSELQSDGLPRPVDDMMTALKRAKGGRRSISLQKYFTFVVWGKRYCICVCHSYRTLSGVLRPTDMMQMRYAFQAIDRNNDGYLTTEELLTFAQEIGYETFIVCNTFTVKQIFSDCKLKHVCWHGCPCQNYIDYLSGERLHVE